MKSDENKFEVKLKSEMYNHDNEKIIHREENKINTNSYKILFVLGIAFIIILITIIILLIS